jgi:hypothetical protein
MERPEISDKTIDDILPSKGNIATKIHELPYSAKERIYVSWNAREIEKIITVHLSEFIPKKESAIKLKFQELCTKWKIETITCASPTKKYLNENYLKIIKLGEKVIPFILQEMKRDPDDWFLALRILSETNPVNPEESKNFRLATDAWIKWGEENKLI